MFRRKEDSLFDNDIHEEEIESVTVQTSSENTVESASGKNSTANTPSAVFPAKTAAQPITRPSAAVPPVAASQRSPSSSSAANTSIPSAPTSSLTRSSEAKSMTNSNISVPSSSSSSASKANSRVLTVGNDILLKGEIATCDRLVIEGKVEATITDVNSLELAECGSFKGSANVVEAHISGQFDGDLVVTGRLVIYASGKVRGNITYGEIEIERGGELSGQINNAVASQLASKAARKEAA